MYDIYIAHMERKAYYQYFSTHVVGTLGQEKQENNAESVKREKP